MKNIIKVICLILMSISIVEAVEIKPNISCGVLLNDVGALGVNESQSKGGINGSVDVLCKINNNLSVGGETGFIRIYNWKYSTVAGSNIELTYDTIPVLVVAEYKFSKNKTFIPYGIFSCGVFVTSLKTVSNVAGISVETDSVKNCQCSVSQIS